MYSQIQLGECDSNAFLRKGEQTFSVHRFVVETLLKEQLTDCYVSLTFPSASYFSFSYI